MAVAFMSTTTALGFQEIIFNIPVTKKSVKAEAKPGERFVAFRELDEDDEYLVRRATQRPRGDDDDDEYKGSLADWYASEAAAQERLEEARMEWLNRLGNRDLDRLDRASPP
jgi:CHASE2 domain-containing sensor protein